MNTKRVVLGGLAAGLIVWLVEGLGSMFTLNEMQSALRVHTLTMHVTAGNVVASIVLSLLVGLTLVFFYAAVRPRYGPGPMTAARVSCTLWLASYVTCLIGFGMIGLYPLGLLVKWSVIGLVELLIAGFVGAALYSEAAPATL